VIDVINRLAYLGTQGSYLKQLMQDKLIEHNLYINQHGKDLSEIRDWQWSSEAIPNEKLSENTAVLT
jgi:xylulose-5-phosphate/fructose-6-phosphate phosphoketolase